MRGIIKRALAGLCGYRFEGCISLANIGEGTHVDSITKLADAAITTRNLLVKKGTDIDHVALNGANDMPMGACSDEAAAAADPVDVQLFGCAQRTRLMVASEAIAAMAEVYTAASGKIQDEPVVAGTYYRVGRALEAASADGDVIEIDPYPPTALVVT